MAVRGGEQEKERGDEREASETKQHSNPSAFDTRPGCFVWPKDLLCFAAQVEHTHTHAEAKKYCCWKILIYLLSKTAATSAAAAAAARSLPTEP